MKEILEAFELLDTTGDINAISECMWSSCEKAISDSCVPKVKDGNDRPCEESDFEIYRPFAERNIQSLKTFLSKINSLSEGGSSEKIKLRKSFIISILLLCGEHGFNDVWTTNETVKLCKEVLTVLCSLCDSKTSDKLLIGNTMNNYSLLKPALLALRPKLLKDSWKCYPGAVVSYKWLLLQVKSPHLSDQLNIVLPTALIILDDYTPENRVCGIICIQHIVENVSRTILSWYGQGDVIYKALEPILYQREVILIRPAISCVVAVLANVEGGPDADIKKAEWSRYDDSLQIILQSMELEQRCDLRLAYIESLVVFLDSMGLGLVRWSKRLLRILQEYLEVAVYSDMAAAKFALQALQVYLKKCHPRIQHHCEHILSMLLRMLYDATSNTEQTAVTKEVLHLIEECLKTVVESAPEQTKLLCADLKTQARFNKTFTEIIDRVFV